MASFFVLRPPIVRAVEWKGDNFAEVSALVGPNRPLSDNGDGTLTSGGGFYPTQIVPSGTWLDENGAQFDPSFYQQVPSESISYVVE